MVRPYALALAVFLSLTVHAQPHRSACQSWFTRTGASALILMTAAVPAHADLRSFSCETFNRQDPALKIEVAGTLSVTDDGLKTAGPVRITGLGLPGAMRYAMIPVGKSPNLHFDRNDVRMNYMPAQDRLQIEASDATSFVAITTPINALGTLVLQIDRPDGSRFSLTNRTRCHFAE